MSRKAGMLLKAQAKDFIKEKKSYCTREEKRAWRIALRERKKAWRKSLEAMDTQAQRLEKKKALRFWMLVYTKQILIAAALLIALPVLGIILL